MKKEDWTMEIIEKKLHREETKYKVYRNLNIGLNAFIILAVSDAVLLHSEEYYYNLTNFVSMFSFHKLQSEKNEVIFDSKEEEHQYKVTNLLLSSCFLLLSGASISYAVDRNYHLFPVIVPCVAFVVKPLIERKIQSQIIKVFDLLEALENNEVEETIMKK